MRAAGMLLGVLATAMAASTPLTPQQVDDACFLQDLESSPTLSLLSSGCRETQLILRCRSALISSIGTTHPAHLLDSFGACLVHGGCPPLDTAASAKAVRRLTTGNCARASTVPKNKVEELRRRKREKGGAGDDKSHTSSDKKDPAAATAAAAAATTQSPAAAAATTTDSPASAAATTKPEATPESSKPAPSSTDSARPSTSPSPSSTAPSSTPTALLTSTPSTGMATTAPPDGATTTSGPLVCLTTSQMTTTWCITSTVNPSSTATTCIPTFTAVISCAPGLICQTQAAGETTCMVRQDNLTTSGLIVTLVFALVLLIFVGSLIAMCLKTRRQSRKIQLTRDAALVSSLQSKNMRDVESSMAFNRGRARGASNSDAHLPLMSASAQGPAGSGGGHSREVSADYKAPAGASAAARPLPHRVPSGSYGDNIAAARGTGAGSAGLAVPPLPPLPKGGFTMELDGEEEDMGYRRGR